MAQVIWTDAALANLDSIETYIAQFNPQAAQQTAVRIAEAGASLSEHPDRGRSVGGRLRELTLVWPYIIRYRVSRDRVLILRVRHGARRPDGSPP